MQAEPKEIEYEDLSDKAKVCDILCARDLSERCEDDKGQICSCYESSFSALAKEEGVSDFDEEDFEDEEEDDDEEDEESDFDDEDEEEIESGNIILEVDKDCLDK